MRILLYSPDNGVTRNFMPHLWMFLLQSLTPLSKLYREGFAWLASFWRYCLPMVSSATRTSPCGDQNVAARRIFAVQLRCQLRSR